jgi:hypothetical protein
MFTSTGTARSAVGEQNKQPPPWKIPKLDPKKCTLEVLVIGRLKKFRLRTRLDLGKSPQPCESLPAPGCNEKPWKFIEPPGRHLWLGWGVA